MYYIEPKKAGVKDMITVTPTNERTETGARVYTLNANGKTAKIVSVSLAGHSVEINYYVNGEIRGKAHGADNPQMIELMEAWNARWSKKTETVTTEEVAAPVEAEATCTGTGSEWTFKDCKVREEECDGDLHCFVVTMEKNGQIRTQTAIPTSLQDMENARRNLNEGISPLDGWEDGMGNEVCWENAKGEAPAYSFVRMAGHDGSEEGFDTLQEAIDAADDTWYHLTKREKAEYSKPGCYFMVIEGGISEDGDFGNVVRDFTEEEEEKEERIEEWTGTKRISSQGNSLNLAITDACRILGLGRGDVVEITIKRKE